MPLIKQELYCHNCDGYVQFEVNINVDGKYTIPCPKCGHKHHRFIEDKEITTKRWASSNTRYIQVTWATYSVISMDSATNTDGNFYFSPNTTHTASY